MFCLIIMFSLIQTLLSAKEVVNYLTPNQIIFVERSDRLNRLDIFCTSGQQKSLTNALMSSDFHLIESPKHFRLFSDQNYTKIIERFHRLESESRFRVIKWLDNTFATNLRIPSFHYHCIGIITDESYKCHLIVNDIDSYRLSALFIGLLLLFLGPSLSRSVLFFHTSCITLGVFASFLIVFFIIGRYLPRKISGILIMLGSSALVFAFKLMTESLEYILREHTFYVFLYIFFSAFVSFGLSYRFGPVANPKTLNLIQWFLQSIGLIMICMSTEIYEYSFGSILAVILWKAVPIRQLFKFKRKPAKKLLTETEFEIQSDIQTKKALEALKKYCLSSDCNAWDVMCRLKDPIRFAQFIRGENHIRDEEIAVYERRETLIPNNTNNNEDISDEEFHDL